MLVSNEIWADNKYKEFLTGLDNKSTCTVLSTFGKTYRCLKNTAAIKVQELENKGERDFNHYLPIVSGRKAYDAYLSGNFEQGILSLGPAIAFADKLEPAKDILLGIMSQALTANHRYQKLFQN